MYENLQTAFSTRQYMLSKDFEIYYYNDCNTTSVGGHSHDYYEFYIFAGGDVSIHIDRDYPLSAGDLIVIPPGTMHYMINHQPRVPYQRFIFWITEDHINELMQTCPDYGYILQLSSLKKEYIHHYDPLNFNALQAKVFDLLEEVHSQRFGRAAKVGICVSDLLIYINRSVYESNNRAPKQNEKSLYQNVLTYIEQHPDQDLSLDALAEEFFISKYHIAHVFKENLGLSLHQYVLKKRLSLATDAIRTGVEITEAYTSCGFHDYSVFYRAFKKEYGISPKEYQDVYAGPVL